MDILEMKDKIVANFTGENWLEIGVITGFTDLIKNHSRLLRSLHFGDEDYAGNVLSVLQHIDVVDEKKLEIIERYLDKKFPADSIYISAKPSEKKITFAPNVFHIPDGQIEDDLLSVMMPFNAEFSGVYSSIKEAAESVRLRCLRADDIWEESIIVQDIFSLIYRSRILVVDFTGKNPNVMYETGIAHTLGKVVVPISQSIDDVPFDLRHHRVLKYLPNAQGLEELKSNLIARLHTLIS